MVLVELLYKSNIKLEVVLLYWISARLWLSLALGLRPRTSDRITAVLRFCATALPLVWYCLIIFVDLLTQWRWTGRCLEREVHCGNHTSLLTHQFPFLLLSNANILFHLDILFLKVHIWTPFQIHWRSVGDLGFLFCHWNQQTELQNNDSRVQHGCRLRRTS